MLVKKFSNYINFYNQFPSLYDQAQIENNTNEIIFFLGIKRNRIVYKYIKKCIQEKLFSSYDIFWILFIQKEKLNWEFLNLIQKKRTSSIAYEIKYIQGRRFIHNQSSYIEINGLSDAESMTRIETEWDSNPSKLNLLIGLNWENYSYHLSFCNEKEKIKIVKKIISWNQREVEIFFNIIVILEKYKYKNLPKLIIKYKDKMLLLKMLNLTSLRLKNPLIEYKGYINIEKDSYSVQSINDSYSLLNYAYFFNNCIFSNRYQQGLENLKFYLAVLNVSNSFWCLEISLEGKVISCLGKYNKGNIEQIPEIVTIYKDIEDYIKKNA
jgi:hypothetical protein